MDFERLGGSLWSKLDVSGGYFGVTLDSFGVSWELYLGSFWTSFGPFWVTKQKHKLIIPKQINLIKLCVLHQINYVKMPGETFGSSFLVLWRSLGVL